MAVGLGVIGVGFAMLGALLGAKVLAGSNPTGFADLGLAIAGMIVGYPAGIIIGIILIKKLLHQNGTIWLGILGSILGAGLTLLLAEPLQLNSNTNLLFGVFLFIVPVFCLLGFYMKSV
jgi:hypothetical protein